GQAVEGLDAIHTIARGPALAFPRFPTTPSPVDPNAAAPTDRMALQPATIQSASLLRVTVPAGIYPLQVARNVRAGDFRHSLEWPHDPQPGAASDFTWYMRSYNGTAPPDALQVSIRAGTQDIAVTGEPTVPGVYHFHWARPDAAAHDLSLVVGGAVVATLTVP
ncbi:MAG: hypothetical protein LC620_01370, partial [Halobacteriales archaeon]|nr:hypothetical protein [Halobacteriales archaeon]